MYIAKDLTGQPLLGATLSEPAIVTGRGLDV
jgi:hypothetical protein